MNTKPRVELLTIGALSGRTGVNIETIRYYERTGLLPPPPRTAGRRRAFDERHVRRLAFIRRGRDLGFSVNDIRTLLRLAESNETACAATKEIASRHLTDIHDKIASLRKLERALKTMTEACAPGSQQPCPILDALAATH
jgi:MerR family transcriptional regulator, mercuric resistance operon regulatory protein